MRHFPEPPARLLVCGGGRRNRTLMAMLAARSQRRRSSRWRRSGLDGDMLEAQAFAFLAVRVMRGLPTSAPGDDRGAAAGLGRADQPAGGVR